MIDRITKSLVAIAVFATIAVLGMLAGATPVFSQSQRLAVPSYFYPGPLWTKLESGAPKVGLAIINPASGPGAQFDPGYAKQVKETQGHHVIVLGYVDTAYGKRSLADVRKDSKAYFDWYHVDGIFYDEATNDDPGLQYYLNVRAMTRELSPKAMVIINPGTQVTEGYMKAADVICTFESEYKAYETQYSAPSWVTKYPASRFWHIVLFVPNDDDMKKVVQQTKERHAGWVYIAPFTEENNADPYNKLADEPYWTDELDALARKD